LRKIAPPAAVPGLQRANSATDLAGRFAPATLTYVKLGWVRGGIIKAEVQREIGLQGAPEKLLPMVNVRFDVQRRRRLEICHGGVFQQARQPNL
jgi:hypothetical protein